MNCIEGINAHKGIRLTLSNLAQQPLSNLLKHLELNSARIPRFPNLRRHIGFFLARGPLLIVIPVHRSRLGLATRGDADQLLVRAVVHADVLQEILVLLAHEDNIY